MTGARAIWSFENGTHIDIHAIAPSTLVTYAIKLPICSTQERLGVAVQKWQECDIMVAQLGRLAELPLANGLYRVS